MDTYDDDDDVVMLSEPLQPPSDDELFTVPKFNSRREQNTVETVPLRRAASFDSIEDDDDIHETVATLPLPRSQTMKNGLNTQKATQPTQILEDFTDLSSSPAKPTVQVAASSPIGTPLLPRKQSGILASAMAPAGTTFRRPIAPAPASKSLPRPTNESQGPVYRGGSSDSDEEDVRKNDIKPTTFLRKSQYATHEKVPESPEPQAGGNSKFREITSGSFYHGFSNNSNSPPSKRSSDVMANAYGGSGIKRIRQNGPSRALPVARQPSPEMELEDISDYNVRQKVKRLRSMLPQFSVRECLDALNRRKGHYEDTMADLTLVLEKRDAAGNGIQEMVPINIPSSDDELMPTPAAPKRGALPPIIKQQAKAPSRTIAEKWSSTQHVTKAPARQIEAFEEPPKKGRTLIRGRRAPSPGSPEILRPTAQPQTKAKTINVSDDSDDGGSMLSSEPDNQSFDQRVLDFFNTCSAADLADTAVISKDLAEHFISKRPFKSQSAVEKVEAPNAKPSKGKRKVIPLGEKVVEKVQDMLTSYEAVDYLVQKCEDLSKPLNSEMKAWGVNITGANDGELDMTSVQPSQRSSHDSGIGTPVSDDETEVRKQGSRKFISQPATMAEDMKMKDYQVVGVNWMNLLYKRRLSGILADDMGLGKTCQVIGFLAHLKEVGENGPHLIVVPAATLENWLKEFHRFCPSLAVEPYYATNPQERFMMREDISAARNKVNVVVTTYTIAKGKEDFPWLKSFGFCCTVYDEGHVLKNASSQVSRKLIRIESRFRLLLTGTPLQNNLKELISLLAFLMPPMFHEKKDELERIFTHNIKALEENHDALLSAQRITRARTMLTPFILRRKKNQVLKDLPKKERRTEFCSMTAEQAEIYHMWLGKAYSIRERRAKGENVDNESANILMKLRQAAIHPMLFRRLYPDEKLPLIARQCLKDELWRESNPNLITTELDAYSDMEIHTLCDKHKVLKRFALRNDEWLASGKIQKMLELLHKFTEQGHRTLIFSQFVMVLDILELVLERESISYFRLDGNTKVSERQDLIDEFCDDENTTPVFMLSTKAGGAGINLAKANKVIVFDSGFNPQDDIQAENRAHRIGQTKEVEVIRLVTKGTVEEQIHAMGLTKLKLDEQVTGDGAEEQVKNDDQETEKEREGRAEVADLFFQKLSTQTQKDVEAELDVSPTKKETTPRKGSVSGTPRRSRPRKSSSQASPVLKRGKSDVIELDEEEPLSQAVSEQLDDTTNIPARTRRSTRNTSIKI